MTAVRADRPAYATAVDVYRGRAWRDGVLPLPSGRKESPPVGYTGRDGRLPSEADYAKWKSAQGAGNLALRLPTNVAGIDVDQYESKTGADSLRALEQAWGELPPTWISSARSAPSGIRFYRIPEGLELHDKPGADIEVIQHHHRYAVVWPSLHPTGAQYQWVTPDGEMSDGPPCADELPMLPAGWIEGLTKPRGPARTTTFTGRDRGERTAAVERALASSLSEFYGGRHDSAMTGVMALVRLEERDHPGAAEAIEDLRLAFLGATSGSRSADQADREWKRMVDGATEKVNAAPATSPKWGDRLERFDPAELVGPGLHAVPPEPDPTDPGPWGRREYGT